MNLSVCSQSDRCSACPLINLSPSAQLQQKLQAWQGLLNSFLLLKDSPVQTVQLPGLAHRSKLDFVIDPVSGFRGLWSSKTNSIVDLETCSLLTPELLNLYKKFREIPLRFQNKASFRLRVSATDETGIWLDLSHQDTKTFLSELHLVQHVLSLGFVEIGQKGKKLVLITDGKAKLADPELHPWFEAFYQGQWVPLWSYVSSFTQPSFNYHRKMSEHLEIWFSEIKPKSVLEYGSGIGNWTVQLLNHTPRVFISESESGAVKALQKNLEILQLSHSVENYGSSLQHHKKDLPENVDLVFLNPSRSGIGALAESLLKQKPKNIIYVSCFPESLLKDASLWKNHYRLKSSILVDPFSQSPHYEILSWWELIL